MADYKFAYNGPQEGTARALLRDAAVSTKTAIEVGKYLRGRTTKKAKTILELVINKKLAVPYTRFTDGVGHRKGPMSAGRFPLKTSQAFLKLIESAESNANQKGLSDELIITHLMAQKASKPYHNGRLGRRQMKRTHLEIVLVEDPSKPKKTKKTAKPAETAKPQVAHQHTTKQELPEAEKKKDITKPQAENNEEPATKATPKKKVVKTAKKTEES
jgi:large subunit ribosomal protein L22